MVAVNPRFTLLAFSLASLSLSPSADAAAIHARSSDPGSPTKPPRQQAPVLPMPMQRMKMPTQERDQGDMSKRDTFHKSRVVKAETVKRQQEQARFDIKNHVARRRVEARQDKNTSGHIELTSPTGNSTDGPTNDTVIGCLMLNNSTTPNVLDASQNCNTPTTLWMVPSGANRCSLQTQVYDASQNATVPMCATFDPNPPAAQPLTMDPCFDNSTASHKSQTFSYNATTGVVKPMWWKGEDDGKTDNITSASTVNDEEVPSATLNSRDAPPHNVTLVFVPDAVAESQDVSPDSQSMSASATQTDTVTTTVTATATPSFAAADLDPSSTSASFSIASSLASASASASTATPSFAAADFDAASSSIPSQSAFASQSASLSSYSAFPSSSGASTATPSFAAADFDAASSMSAMPSQSASFSSYSAFPSASGDSTAPSSLAAADFDAASSSTASIPSASAMSSSYAPTSSSVGAFDVEVAAVSSSTDPAASTATVSPTPSSYSSVPTASSSTVDAAAIAADIANSSSASFSWSASATSSSASATASTDASPPTGEEQAVYVVGGPAARAEMTPVSTEPYKWMFRAEPRL